MERSVDGIKLHREKYSGDFIPYKLPELSKDVKNLKNFSRLELVSSIIQTRNAYHYTTLPYILRAIFTYNPKLSVVFNINTLTSNISV